MRPCSPASIDRSPVHFDDHRPNRTVSVTPSVGLPWERRRDIGTIGGLELEGDKGWIAGLLLPQLLQLKGAKAANVALGKWAS